MDTKHLVDPELAPLLDQFPKMEFSPEALPVIRAGMDDMFEQQKAMIPDYPDVEVTERRVPGPSGAPDLPVVVYLPKGGPRPMAGLLWIHGGGYIIGTPAMDDANYMLRGIRPYATIVLTNFLPTIGSKPGGLAWQSLLIPRTSSGFATPYLPLIPTLTSG